MIGDLRIVIWDVEHGACAMLQHVSSAGGGPLAMVDSGCTDDWQPSTEIARIGAVLDYLFITNADQDHMSDLDGLWSAGTEPRVLFRNPSYTPDQYRQIKRISGPLSNDAKRYALACGDFNQPVARPFNDHMGGVRVTLYWNSYPEFDNTNDLSLVAFFDYAGFKIAFPGDVEKAGWRALLRRPDFLRELQSTTVLVASHHGRESGFCPEVFEFLRPRAVVISDKPVAHETQRMVPDYRAIIAGDGVTVRTTMRRRHVLTTRRDGTITFTIQANGDFFIDTEYGG
jgi:hypothetical protein